MAKSGLENSINRKNPKASSTHGFCPECGGKGREIEFKYGSHRICDKETCKQVIY